MTPQRFMLPGFAAAAALALGCSLALAQADDGSQVAVEAEAAGPTLDCTTIGLKIMTAEVSGARFDCHVNGASTADTTFTVQVTNLAADTQLSVPLCTGSLASGAGGCSGSFINRDGNGLGQLSLAVTLQPSGSGIGPLVLERSSPPAPAEPMQFYPISE
jgi:hypothetical protein